MTRIEWVIRDIAAKRSCSEPGQAVYSPEFTVQLTDWRLDGARWRGSEQVVKGAKLAFYPCGSTGVTTAGWCSLFLEHKMTTESLEDDKQAIQL